VGRIGIYEGIRIAPFSESPTIHSETSPGTASGHTKRCRGEMFTLLRLKLPPSPYKCLATTNVIESPQSGVARRTANVTRWRDRGMVERWIASAWLLKEKNFRKIDGHRDLWALATILGRQPLVQPIAGEASVK